MGAALVASAACSDMRAVDASRDVDDLSEVTAALVNRSAKDSELFEAHFCGAAIVAERTAVTAAHCVVGRSAESIDLLIGQRDLCKTREQKSVRIPVETVDTIEDEPSLARLKLAVAAPPHVVLTMSRAHHGDIVIAAGWGRPSLGGVPPCGLREVPLRVVPVDACAELTSTTIEPHEGERPVLCTRPAGPANSCDGDSGGPVVSVGEGKPELVAITMSGEGCGASDLGLNVVPNHHLAFPPDREQ